MRFPPEKVKVVRPVLQQALKEEEDILFSFLHGSAHEGLAFRDLDIAVFLRDGDSLEKLTTLAAKLERATTVPCDVHSLNRAPNLFSYQVSKGELLTCLDEAELARWRERVWSEYFRFLPHRERLLSDWLNAG